MEDGGDRRTTSLRRRRRQRIERRRRLEFNSRQQIASALKKNRINDMSDLLVV